MLQGGGGREERAEPPEDIWRHFPRPVPRSSLSLATGACGWVGMERAADTCPTSNLIPPCWNHPLPPWALGNAPRPPNCRPQNAPTSSPPINHGSSQHHPPPLMLSLWGVFHFGGPSRPVERSFRR